MEILKEIDGKNEINVYLGEGVSEDEEGNSSLENWVTKELPNSQNTNDKLSARSRLALFIFIYLFISK